MAEQSEAGRSILPVAIWKYLWRMGVGFPILLGLFLAFAIAVSVVSPGFEPPELIAAGSISDYEVNSPRYFEHERIWVVRMETNEILALYDIDPNSRCTVPWRADFEYMGQTGWFREACQGSVYDLRGYCFGGPCEVGLSRLGVLLQGAEIVIDLGEIIPGESTAPGQTPVNP